MPLLASFGWANFEPPSRMVRFSFFENTDSTFYGKGFKMLQLLKNNFCPSSIFNTFTTLLALFNTTQGDKEGPHEFRAQLEGHMSTLSQPSKTIPLILQGMLFLCAMHSRYQDFLTQFASKQKDLPSAMIDSMWLMLSSWMSSDKYPNLRRLSTTNAW